VEHKNEGTYTCLLKNQKLKRSTALKIKKSLSFIEDIKDLTLQETLQDQYRVCKTKNAEQITWAFEGQTNKDIQRILQAANIKGKL